MEEKDIVMTETGVEVREAAAPESTENVEQATETQPVAENQRNERDAYYADLRRKQELDEARANNARLQQQIDAAHKALGSFFEGNSLEEQLDYARAQTLGVDVSEIRKQRENEAQQAAVQNELNMYRQREIDRMMADDLKAVQAIDATVTSLNDLPPTFLALRFNQNAPMSAEQAFLATRAIEAQTQKAKPASVGSISSAGAVESEFYTSEELDALTPQMLDNPKIMEKAMRSLARITK